jgi:hypothetical protein
MSRSVVQSTLAIAMLSWFLNAAASSAQVGSRRLQWPHQGAKYWGRGEAGGAGA